MSLFIRIATSLRFWIVVGGCVFLGFVLGDVIPLVWTFQQPTYLLERDTIGLTEYTCDTTKTECKINFDFTPSIPTEEPASHYSCIIDFGFGPTTEDAKCNPNTLTFPSGDHTVHVTILHTASGVPMKEGDILIHNGAGADTGGGTSGDGTGGTPVYFGAILWQNSTQLLLKDDATLGEYTCDPEVESCQINLLVTPQKDGQDDSGLTCLITADFELLPSASDPCNPLQSQVPSGDHTINIQILQKSDSSVVITRTLSIKNPPKDTSIDPLRVTSTFVWQQTTHLLQKEDTSLSEYTCDPEQPECKINLLVTPLLDGADSSRLICEITADFPLELTDDSCNPNNSIVPVGDHIVTIKILNKSDNSLLTTREILLKNPIIDTSIDPLRITSALTWQSPTYLFSKEDTSLMEYTCDVSQSDCKINPLFKPLLDGLESSKLTCEITSDFPLEPTTDPCNPNTSIVPVGDHIISFKILQKSDNAILTTREILLKNPIRATGGGSSGGGGGGVSMMNLNSVQMTIQSGLDADGRCHSDTCQVNFLAEAPANALCHWNFGTGIFETESTQTKCNPGYVKFPFDTIVSLVVSDPAFPNNSITRTLKVFHEITPLSSTSPQAYIDLQGTRGKNKRLISGGIICAIGDDATCSLNFTGEKSLNAHSYFWSLGNGNTSEKENPSTEKYPLGNHRVVLRILSATGISSEAYYDIQVVKKFDTEEKKCENCEKMKGKIQISAVLPNPPHADTVEWIELKNISSESYPLDACVLSDDTRDFTLSGVIAPGKTLRLRQIQTGISLGNSHDTLEMHCGDFLIDSFSWDFDIPSGYILRREMLDNPPTQVSVVSVVDGDTIDVMLRNKKTRIRLLGVDTPETVHPRKEVEKFGKEASDFTKQTLTGKKVWMTFDHELLDHYGRTLGYIWECDGDFSLDRCYLFNARLISEGYARMERRFEFMYYDSFDALEKSAKKSKIGIWSDPLVAKTLDETSSEEEEALKKEQEEEYLRLQKELLELEKKKCEEEGICELPSWEEVTKKMTALSTRTYTSGLLKVSGHTWGDLPVKITFFLGNREMYSSQIITDSTGYYELTWYPRVVGNYTVSAIFQEQTPLKSVTASVGILTLQKDINVDVISDHFLAPLTGEIFVQGKMSKNRWVGEDGVFQCRSRGSCSVNLEAEYNRKKDITYTWTLPNGEIFVGKNPPSFKIKYGDFVVKLHISDTITGENSETELPIHHGAIPKAPKKVSAKSSKYTLDFKDATQDIGGGALPEPSASLRSVLLVLLSLSGISFLVFGKQRTQVLTSEKYP